MYLCGECGNCYDDADAFDQHLEESHTNIKLNYVCEDCGETFKKLQDFQHHRLSHADVADVLTCEKCEKEFINEESFEEHSKECGSNLQYQCPLCKKIDTKENIFKDFKEEHKISLVSETKSFDSYDDFVTWKDNYEQQNILCYIEGIKTMKKNGGQYYQYYCHHGRPFQLNGSSDCKISYWCPSEIVADVNENGETSVTFIKTHVGHRPGIDINKLLPDSNITNLMVTETPGNIQNLVSLKAEPNEETDVVANEGQSCGIELKTLFPDAIFNNNIVEENTESLLNVEHSLNANEISDFSNSDLNNELQDFVNVKGGRKSRVNTGENKPKPHGRPKPFQSLDSWVQEKSIKECVKFFKAQGETSTKYPSLDLNRYALIISTKAPIDILKKFGHNLVCIDRQYGETFELVTVLVIEELNQSFPCAFLVTNKADSVVMEVLFNEIKETVGIIHAKLFMSEKASFVSDAWDKVMIPPQKKMLCSWNVLDDWKSNINTITNSEKQELTFKALSNLLEEPEEKTFTSLFQLVLSELQSDPETSEFGGYLSLNYSSIPDAWACCYRPSQGIQDNGTLEKIHCVLKQILRGSTKRIDRAVNAILNYLRSKIYDRLMLMSKGKVSAKLTEVDRRHKISLRYVYQVINHGEYWAVVSAKKENNRVKISNQFCDCQVKCKVCNVCAHIYICTCFDSLVRLNMCRHIHALCMAEASGNVEAGDGSGSWGSIHSPKRVKESDFDLNCVKQEHKTSRSKIISQDTQLLFDTVKEEIETDQCTSELQFSPDGNDNEDDSASFYKERTLISPDRLEYRKTNVDKLFRTIISDVNTEQQLVEVEKALLAVEKKLKKLRPKSVNNRSPKKRTHEEMKQIHQKGTIVLSPVSSKKPKVSKVYKTAFYD